LLQRLGSSSEERYTKVGGLKKRHGTRDMLVSRSDFIDGREREWWRDLIYCRDKGRGKR